MRKETALNQTEEHVTQLTSPDLSVVVVSLDSYERIRLTVAALRAQTAKRQLEIVIVAPSREGLNLEGADLQEFLSYQVVEVGPIQSTGGAIAAGFQRAHAPVVVYAGEHSYPFPTWAEALLLAHKKPWGAVGAALVNANPGTNISWTNLFTDFGSSVAPAVGGAICHLARHHGSYKRELLSEYSPDQLQMFLETEGFFHQALRDRGYQLYFEPAAKSNHVNVSTVSSLIRCEYVEGRLFGAARMRYEQWSRARRILYIFGSPLIPVRRLRLTLQEVRRAGQWDTLFPQILPGLLISLVAHCLGEISGYAFGAGNAAWQRVPCELNRYEFLRDSEKPTKGVVNAV